MTDVGLGLVSFLGTGEESAYGTPVTRTRFHEINEEDLSVEEGRIESGALAQVGIRNTKVAQGGVGVSGGFSFDAPYAGWERLLKHVMGSIASIQPDPTNASSAWRHTFTIADELPTGLTVEVFRDTGNFTTEPDKSFVYSGCVLTAMNLSCGVDDLLKARFDLMGRQEARESKSTPSYDDSTLAVFHQGTLKWNAHDVCVSSFSFDLNNALEARPKLGSRFTRAPKRSGKLDVSGTFQAEFDSWSQYDDFRNKTERELIIDFVGPTIEGSITYQVKITVAIALINSYRVIADSPGRLMMEVGFKAYRTDSAGELEIELTNDVTPSLAQN